jgi:hypothetical protein
MGQVHKKAAFNMDSTPIFREWFCKIEIGHRGKENTEKIKIERN